MHCPSPSQPERHGAAPEWRAAMRLALGLATLSLAASLTPQAVAQTPSNAFPAERASAQTMRDEGRFVVACVDGRISFRVGLHFVTDTDWCNENRPLPMLVRARRFAGGETLLIVLGVGDQQTNTGYVLYLDEDSARPLRLIGIGSVDDFGEALALDEVVIINGELANHCGSLRETRALRLDWARDQVSRARLLTQNVGPC
jgi:hypothetical protein